MTIKDAVQEFESEKVTRALHQTIKKVTTDIESMRFNTAVAQMMTFVNVVGDEGGISKPGFETFLTLLCPFAPHVANELYEQMGGVGFLEACEWPIFNEDLAAEKELNIAVQVNGKLRSTIVVKAGTGEDEVVALARAEENVDKFMVTEPSKIIYVPGKLVNFVI
ncbi:MAG: class I tRNA ligase family protein [Candidatus Uhrbacteria bacterium]|nr:class I tRNA ligase family protein [Candidatus Uhrbacteria bacterium]